VRGYPLFLPPSSFPFHFLPLPPPPSSFFSDIEWVRIRRVAEAGVTGRPIRAAVLLSFFFSLFLFFFTLGDGIGPAKACICNMRNEPLIDERRNGRIGNALLSSPSFFFPLRGVGENQLPSMDGRVGATSSLSALAPFSFFFLFPPCQETKGTAMITRADIK